MDTHTSSCILWIWLRLAGCFLTMQDIWIGSSVFSNFLLIVMKLDSHEVREVTQLDFSKIVSSDQEGENKSQKMAQEWGFWDLDKNLIYSYVHLVLVYVLWYFRSQKIQFLWSKNLKTNQNTRFFKLHYLTNRLRYELEFLYMVRDPSTSYCISKMNLSVNFIFFHVVRHI